ncbi:MAG: RTX toxin, partial [Acidobacteriota bacterium]
LFGLNVFNPYYWQSLDVPDVNPGGQGYIHFSIAADPYDVNILYVGGDRQEGPFPNAIGATSFTGNLWRGNVTQPSGSQFAHLTHSNSVGPVGGGTASGTAPHADSRDIVFDAWGQLIQVDDGGVYAQTSPRDNTGDWFSLNGNLQATELKDVSYDSVSQSFFGGAQDNGNHYQLATGSATWGGLLVGDGGDTAVDPNIAPGLSVRYTSTQFLGNFLFTVWNAAGQLTNFDFQDLNVIDGGPAIEPQFYTPIATNQGQGGRLVFGGANAVYESFDLGDSLLTVSTRRVNGDGLGPISYGAADNPDVLYFGSGSQVFVRDAGYPDAAQDAVTFPARGLDLVVSIDGDPQTAATAFVLTL